MLRFIVGVFMILHGLVHLLYAGHSWRLFDLQPGLMWPDGSWAFARLLGNEATRSLAGGFCMLAAVSFVVSGIAVFARQAWWQPVVVFAAAFSAALFIVFWDAGLQELPAKGMFGLLINLAILGAVLLLRWPSFEF